jgi:lipoprotein-releasing system permease protein
MIVGAAVVAASTVGAYFVNRYAPPNFSYDPITKTASAPDHPRALYGIAAAGTIGFLIFLIGSIVRWRGRAVKSNIEWRRVSRIATLVSGLLFVGLTAWVRFKPPHRGIASSFSESMSPSGWSLTETLLKAGAVLAGVVFTIFFLATVLPWILDKLEGRTFVSFVAARHVRSQKSGFLTVISVLSICGVAVSSCALSTVVSVMGGFSQDLKRKILGNNAHIVVDTVSQSPWSDYEPVLARIRNVHGVTGATPVASGEAMISSLSNLAGVIVRGVDPKSIESVIDLPHIVELGKFEYLIDPEKLRHLPADEVIGTGPGGEQFLHGSELGTQFTSLDDIDPLVKASLAPSMPLRPGLIIGRELAKTLHVYIGDEVTIVSPLGDLGPMGVMPRTKKFRVAAIFYSGMYEFDATQVYSLIGVAQEYFAMGSKISVIDVKLEDAERADQMKPAVEAAVARTDLRVRDWRDLNKNLFSALKLERFAAFIILSLAIMVASFCIICTLLLMVTEKGKEIAILKAVGASDAAIRRTFMTEGMIIGAIGTVFGVVSALALCAGLSWFGLRLDPDVYYIDRLPISVNGWDFLGVAIAAFIICTISTIYPAHAASKLRPVEGLRYE